MKHSVLYFGSFNPIHKGHTAIMRHVVDAGLCDKVLVVVSPQNPFKEDSLLIDKHHRLRMIELAIAEEGLQGQVEACGIEFELPKPSYTANTLRELQQRYADEKFSILMGGDNLAGLESWRESEWITSNFDILVYPRSDSHTPRLISPRTTMLSGVELLEVSSTQIREELTSSKDSPKWLHYSVYKHIKDHQLWT